MQEKKKILFVITKGEPFGGAQKYVHDLAVDLAHGNYDVVVALGGSTEDKNTLQERLKKNGIRTIEIKQLQRNVHIFKELQALRALRRIYKTEQPDIIHLNSSKAGGVGAFAGRLTGIKRIVFTAHGWAFKEDRDPVSKIVLKCLSWLTVLLTHHTIVVSENDKRHAAWMPFVQHKIGVIPIAIAPIHFVDRAVAQKTLAQKLKIPIPESVTWLGTIAELHKNKGLEYLTQALARLVKHGHNSILFVIGDGEEKTALQKLVTALSLEKHVVFVGALPNAAKYLKAFDIFTLPSVKEGMPYTIIEAGYAGLPVVATDVGGIPEIIDDMQSGILVRPKNAAELADALIYLLQHQEKRAQFGRTLYQKTTEEHTLAHMLHATKKVYSLV